MLATHNLCSLRYLLLNGILSVTAFRQRCAACKSRAAGWNHGAAPFVRNQPSGLELLNSGKVRAKAAVASRVRGRAAFSIFCWLEVLDFDLFLSFLCLLLFSLHISFRCLLFVLCQ